METQLRKGIFGMIVAVFSQKPPLNALPNLRPISSAAYAHGPCLVLGRREEKRKITHLVFLTHQGLVLCPLSTSVIKRHSSPCRRVGLQNTHGVPENSWLCTLSATEVVVTSSSTPVHHPAINARACIRGYARRAEVGYSSLNSSNVESFCMGTAVNRPVAWEFEVFPFVALRF